MSGDVDIDDPILEWSRPVLIRIGYGASEAVKGPLEAIGYLVQRWPEAGVYRELATLKCTAAAKRHGSAEEAREVFVAAALEAYILA